MTFTNTNTLEGVTPSGTTVTAANSGGTSGTAFTTAQITVPSGGTLASDSTRAAHGSLSLKCSTVAAANWTVGWSGFSLTGITIWYRFYAYFTANPAAVIRLLDADPASGTCGSLELNTTGTIRVNNSAGSQLTVTTTVIPLNAWFRVEGFFTCSTTTGSAEIKLFTSMDSVTAADTKTSAASQNLNTAPTKFFFGNSGSSAANVGPFWFDDLGLTDQGYLGPAAVAAAIPDVVMAPMTGA